VSPSAARNTGIPSNWPPIYQTGRVAQFNYHTGIAVNTIGSLMFVADTGQNLVRLVYCASGSCDVRLDLRNGKIVKDTTSHSGNALGLLVFPHAVPR